MLYLAPSYQHIPLTAPSFSVRQRCRLFMSKSYLLDVQRNQTQLSFNKIRSLIRWFRHNCVDYLSTQKSCDVMNSVDTTNAPSFSHMSFDDGLHNRIHFVPTLMLVESARNHCHQDLTTVYSPISPLMEIKLLIYHYSTNSKSTCSFESIIKTISRTIVR